MINIDEPLINKNSFTLEDISLSSSSSSLSSLSSLSSNDFLNITRLQSYICFFYYASIGSILLIVGIIIINIFFL